MLMQTLFFSVECKKGLQSNQIKKVLQSNLSKYNKKKPYNVEKLNKTNLGCLDRLNQHCNTSFVR